MTLLAPLPSALDRPPQPDFVRQWDARRQHVYDLAKHYVKRLAISTVDRGWLGLKPLQKHIVICGFPRSGSSLLQLQIETCVADVRTFGHEVQALVAAQRAVRNHAFMLTKLPWDICFTDEIRSYYAARQAEVCFLVTVRDPRAVLTSVYQGMPRDQAGGYFEYPERWRAYYQHVRYAQQFDDVMTIEYRDIVCKPRDVQQALTRRLGWHVNLPFDEFHVAAAAGFAGGCKGDPSPLNGLRPLDPSRLDAWRHEKHKARIRTVLREIPELPEVLIEMGYERDDSWVREYLPEGTIAFRDGMGFGAEPPSALSLEREPESATCEARSWKLDSTDHPVISNSVAEARLLTRRAPPLPRDFEADWPTPRPGITWAMRRGVRKSLYKAFENGWLGLRPLRTHVVICGFERSGSTLLQLMVQSCVSDIKSFGSEMSVAWVQYLLTNHSFLVTKAPWDILHADKIRDLYATRRAEARFVVTVRDPRAILTSVHAKIRGGPDGYFLDPPRWVHYYNHVRYAQQFDDALLVEYEDVVCRPAEIQRRLTDFIGWDVHLPFDQFHTAVPPDFVQVHLNGLRPLDRSRLDAWRQDQHRARIQRVLKEIPELPDCLIELGYERDSDWVRDYI
jgi:Sulfotransferase family